MNEAWMTLKTNAAQKCRSSMVDRAGRVNCLLCEPDGDGAGRRQKPPP
jgi:hypothetical protein